MTERIISENIFQQNSLYIPGGVNSPVRAGKEVGLTPPFIAASGRGDLLFDVDKQGYIDYCMSWGALLFGHGRPEIIRGVQEQLEQGTTFGTSTQLEGEVAKRLCEQIPSLEKVRFVSSGTEATMSALRLARGYTGKTKIGKCTGHYHGHVDSLLTHSKGIPSSFLETTLEIPFNDCKKAKELFSSHPDLAAFIVEPVAGNMGVVPPDPSFLHLLREETKKIGALLIFDEVITGFRVGKQGAQGLFQIEPDLSCFAKVLGGGLPLGAFGGKREIFESLAPLGGVYQAGTFAGNPIAIRAAWEALELIESPYLYKELEKKTERLLLPLKERLQKGVIQSVGSMFTLFFGPSKIRCQEDLFQVNRELYRELFHDLFAQKIYIPPSPFEAWFISTSHTEEHLDVTREAIEAFLARKGL